MINLPPSVDNNVSQRGGMTGILENIPTTDALDFEARVHKALSDPTRLKVCYLLSLQPLCVCLIKSALSIPDSKLSYHLGVLRDGEVIKGTQEKNWIIYSLTDQGKRYIDGIKR